MVSKAGWPFAYVKTLLLNGWCRLQMVFYKESSSFLVGLELFWPLLIKRKKRKKNGFLIASTSSTITQTLGQLGSVESQAHI